MAEETSSSSDNTTAQLVPYQPECIPHSNGFPKNIENIIMKMDDATIKNSIGAKNHFSIENAVLSNLYPYPLGMPLIQSNGLLNQKISENGVMNNSTIEGTSNSAPTDYLNRTFPPMRPKSAVGLPDDDLHSHLSLSLNKVRIHSCKYCNLVFVRKVDLTKHTKIDHKDKERKTYSCKHCQREFINKSHFNYHNKSHLDKLSGLPPKPVVEAKIYYCKFCERQFEKKSFLSGHVRDVHPDYVHEPYSCNDCGRSFVNKSHFQYHFKNHINSKPLICVFCGKQFIHKTNLDKHMAIHSNKITIDNSICKRSYTCEFCNKIFANKSHLDYHYSIHTGEKPFACEICAKQFSHKSYLHSHMKTHESADKTYKCMKCDMSFAYKVNLTSHMLYTHPDVQSEPDFTCSNCHKDFVNKSHFDYHHKQNMCEKQFICLNCKRQFKSAENLEKHKRIHTLE